MEKIIVGEWEIEYDKTQTEEAYRKKVEGCDCISCRNFYQATQSVSNEIKTFFADFGIDMAKPAEIFDVSTYKNGKILYLGFYHIIGSITKGRDVWEPTGNKNGAETCSQNNMFKITDELEIGFTFQTTMVDEHFPANICQMEISLWLPWLMEDRDYLEHFEIENQ
jgi:hypothetical protein